jgi:hypothetical protein
MSYPQDPVPSPHHQISHTTAAIDDEEMLNYTQGVRKDIIVALTKQGIPSEAPDTVNLMLKTLGDMDRNSLGRMRLKVEENAGKGLAGAAVVVAEMLNKMGNMRPFQSPVPVARGGAPELGHDIPPPSLVAGEIDTNAAQRSYDAFIEANGGVYSNIEETNPDE